MIQRFVIVMIVLAPDENPYLIFESLNAKGQPLTQADLRKELSVHACGKSRRATHSIRRTLATHGRYARRRASRLYVALHLTKDGTFVRQNSIYEAIKSRLSNLASTEQVIDVLADMHTYSTFYARLIDTKHEPDVGVRTRLLRLHRWEISTALPFLLALYHDYEHGEVSAGEFCDVLDAIESFLVRRTFCDIPSNILNRMFIGIYKNLDRTDVVGSLKTHLAARRWPDDRSFRMVGIAMVYIKAGHGVVMCWNQLSNAFSAIMSQ